jgi:ATP-dependent helicase YprA (DUF1998 family)
MSKTKSETPSFRELNIAEPLLRALDKIGYETPSPIQAQAIPPLLKGKDLLGHAPTGTGKTAAFALPLLSRLDMQSKAVQADLRRTGVLGADPATASWRAGRGGYTRARYGSHAKRHTEARWATGIGAG